MSESLREIWKTTQSNHDLGNVTLIIRMKIISLGIRKQPISHPYCRSRAGNSLFHKIITILTIHAQVLHLTRSDICNLVCIPQSSTRTNEKDQYMHLAHVNANQSTTTSCRPRNIYLEVKLTSVQSQKPGLNPVMNTPVKTLHHRATYAVLYPIQMTGLEEALHYYTAQVLKSNN